MVIKSNRRSEHKRRAGMSVVPNGTVCVRVAQRLEVIMVMRRMMEFWMCLVGKTSYDADVFWVWKWRNMGIGTRSATSLHPPFNSLSSSVWVPDYVSWAGSVACKSAKSFSFRLFRYRVATPYGLLWRHGQWSGNSSTIIYLISSDNNTSWCTTTDSGLPYRVHISSP